MDIEDDFIEDSESSETSDNDENSFFLTATQADEPKEIVLKPAVNVYPLTTLTQNLLSKMYSLINFGQSSIGVSIQGSVYDLSKHLKKVNDDFPKFVREANVYSNSKQYALQKKLMQMKIRIHHLKESNLKAKERVRNNSRRLPNLNKDDSNYHYSDAEKFKNEAKACAYSLNRAVEKLKVMNMNNDKIQLENENIQKQINHIISMFKHNCFGEEGQINRNIVKTEIELCNNVQKHKENLITAQQIVDSYKAPIQSLEARLADLNRRITTFVKPIRMNKLQKIRV